MKNWTIAKAKEFYNIGRWGQGYFDISETGSVVAMPQQEQSGLGIDLSELVQQIQEAGLHLPVLIRFDEILHRRVRELHQAFANARVQYDYQSQYTAVYPIKVNQQRRVLEEILAGAAAGPVGLEAGSKAELMVVLGILQQPNSTVICNGYKDREYIRLALIGQQLGHQVYIIIEKLSEIDLVLQEAKDLNIVPLLGVRVRLSSIAKGNWQNTGGEKSKFGLTASHVMRALAKLNEAGMQNCLQLLHFHLGSQVSNIGDIQNGFREAAQTFVNLWRLHVAIKVVDIGGGLGVDYEGTATRTFCSINYDIQEYANEATAAFAKVCCDHNLPQPGLITEAGRAMTAHHAVLITEAVDVETIAFDANEMVMPTKEEPAIVQDLWASLAKLSPRTVTETYHHLCQGINEVQVQFIQGKLTLPERARAEEIYLFACQQLRALIDPRIKPQRVILDELNEKLADKLFCNFSLFQSIPDSWAIDQVFPVLPLSGLDKPPERRAVVQDITCDSDGRIDYYVDDQGLEATLPFPEPLADKPLYIGIFLVGAYQEILGDIHNLFGDTDSVHVRCDATGRFQLREIIRGDTIEDLLKCVNFDPKRLLLSYQAQFDEAECPALLRDQYLAELKQQLSGYAYLRSQ